MVCPKCAGLMIYENVVDFFSPKNMARCLNCGLITDWQIHANQRLSLVKGVEMPRFLSEDDKEAWSKKVEAVHAKKMAGRKRQNEEVIILEDDLVLWQ